MDDGDQHRKQNAIRGYPGVPPLVPADESPGQQPRRPRHERSGQVPMLAAHRSSPTMATGTPSGYGYYDEGSQGSSLPLPSTALQYQSEFPQEQQRQQTFPQYGAGLMYGIPQQVPPNQPYNTVQPYQQPRRSAAIEVLSTQFAGVPPFYVPGEPTSASAATVPSQPAPSQFPSHTYAQQPTGARSSLAPVYAPAMSDVPQMGASQPVPTQDYGQSAPNYDVAYGQYQNALKRTFQNIRNGQLAEAGQTLLEISEWLLTHAAELGKHL